MAGLERGHDAELDELFRAEPELLALSERLRAARPEPLLDPRFKAVLRSRVLDAAERELGRRPITARRPWFLRGGPIALGGGLGAAMVAAAVAAVLLYHPSDRVTSPSATSSASGVARLDPNSVIRVSFTQPMDRATVLRGLDIRPATAYTTSWSRGDTVLTIVPTHHLAANTGYTVTIAHTVARDAAGQAPRQDIQVSFGTASTPSPVTSSPP
ncbi:MAG: Ig-like domain-containing protein, partial [Candidatus Dormibacteria bacterium]